MKNKRLLESLNFIDEKYIKEAEPKMKASSISPMKIFGRVACLVIVIALSLYLFIPFSTKGPDLTAYQSSEYFPIIERISDYCYKPSPYKNNFQYITAEVGDLLGSLSKGGMLGGDMAPGDGGADMNGSANGSYEETTDNQVSGVIEADLMKRTDKYIFRLTDTHLRVYDINKEETTKITEFQIPHVVKDLKKSGNYTEMYLSEDGNTVIIVALYFDWNTHYTYTGKVGITALDVSDINNIKVKDSVIIDGKYNTSRMVNGKLLLVSNYEVKASNIDYNSPETYVPKITRGDKSECIKIEDIIYPDTIKSTKYSIVATMDASSLELLSANALLDFSSNVFVSESNVYVTREYSAKTDVAEDGSYVSKVMSDVAVLGYENGVLENKGVFTVEGKTKDQYSMDEYEGHLRIVTSTSESIYKSDNGDYAYRTGRKENVSLAVFNIESGEKIAEVKSFAPDGEEATSVRFDGNTAYVCTAEVVTFCDPVYFFDLSDYSNITYTDTGVIDGFSSTLIQLGDGFLLGIGEESLDKGKIEVYAEMDGQVVSVAKYVFEGGYTTEYKSYFIDRESKTVGIPVSNLSTIRNEYGYDYVWYIDGYLLFTFDEENYDYSIRIIEKEWYNEEDRVRAFSDDGYLYITTDKDITVEKITE
jgi:uncharacterized secreted protein with C-terminal beta-propeller domain